MITQRPPVALGIRTVFMAFTAAPLNHLKHCEPLKSEIATAPRHFPRNESSFGKQKAPAPLADFHSNPNLIVSVSFNVNNGGIKYAGLAFFKKPGEYMQSAVERLPQKTGGINSSVSRPCLLWAERNNSVEQNEKFARIHTFLCLCAREMSEEASGAKTAPSINFPDFKSLFLSILVEWPQGLAALPLNAGRTMCITEL